MESEQVADNPSTDTQLARMEKWGFIQISGTFFRHLALDCEIDIRQAPPDDEQFIVEIFQRGQLRGRSDQQQRIRQLLGIPD